MPIPFFLDKICVMRYNSASVYCSFKEIAVSVQAKQKSTMNWLLKQIIGDDMPVGVVSSCEIGERGMMKIVIPLFKGAVYLTFGALCLATIIVVVGSLVYNINDSRALTIASIVVVTLAVVYVNSPVMTFLFSWTLWDIKILSWRLSLLGVVITTAMTFLFGYTFLYFRLNVSDVHFSPALDMTLKAIAFFGLSFAISLTLVLAVAIPTKIIIFTYKHTLGVPKKIKIVVPGGDTVEKTYPFYKWLAIKMHLCTVFAN